MRNKSNLTFYTFLFSLCISLFSFSKLIAQENEIYELNESNAVSKDNNTSKESSKKEKTDNRDSRNHRDEFYELTYKLHPTSYIENNSIKNSSHNDSSISKLTFYDTKSFNILNKNNSNFNNVELITIKLKTANDLNNKLKLNDIRGFNKLKYIYIKCDFKCTEKQIKEFVSSDLNVRIFYKIENPS